MDKNTTSHILLVDDETAITENLAPFLERAGYKVATATKGGLHAYTENTTNYSA